MTDGGVLTFEKTIAAPAAGIFRAFTNAMVLREWMCDAALADAHPGGRFYLWWDHGYYSAGTFLDLTPVTHVAFTWRGPDEPAATKVDLHLQPQEGNTTLRLIHSGFAEGQAWQAIRARLQAQWQDHLENLVSVLETGRDLRFTRRPMLGIMVGEFNPEIAAAMAAPVEEAIRVDDVLPDMGAAAAGLQADDIIVSIGGKATKDWASLAASLRPHHAGDEVTVTYYRAGERQQTTMTLSSRPLPEIPPTAAALAATVAAIYREEETLLQDCFRNVPEEAAAAAPAPGEWSANETLAHLIANERETHVWIVDAINDRERWADLWRNPTTVPARLAAIVDVYGTAAALREALHRDRALTVAMLERLPDSVVAHKGTYFRLAFNLLQSSAHVEAHCVQIRAALAAGNA
jgi:uncharacterized protein YndB with AHSA1/START domain